MNKVEKFKLSVCLVYAIIVSWDHGREEAIALKQMRLEMKSTQKQTHAIFFLKLPFRIKILKINHSTWDSNLPMPILQNSQKSLLINAQNLQLSWNRFMREKPQLIL